jgi:hypothetical protein
MTAFPQGISQATPGDFRQQAYNQLLRFLGNLGAAGFLHPVHVGLLQLLHGCPVKQFQQDPGIHQAVAPAWRLDLLEPLQVYPAGGLAAYRPPPVSPSPSDHRVGLPDG